MYQLFIQQLHKLTNKQNYMEEIKQYNQSDIIIGNVTLNNQFTNEMKKSLIKQHHTQIIKKSQWFIQSKCFTQNKWNQIIPYMRQVRCSTLNLPYNYHSQIILNISQPVFINLKQLILCKNKIINIEELSFLNMQNLQAIVLSYNFITNIKSLNKTKWNQINYFTINDNEIKDILLNRIKFSQVSKNLNFQFNSDDSIAKQDISFIMKLQSSLINKIYVIAQRIKQLKVFDSLKKKHADIKIIER